MQNAYASPTTGFTGPADPYFQYQGQVVVTPEAWPFTSRPAGAGPWNWSENTCVQLLYSMRLQKWMLPSSYRAQYQFTLARRFYAVPLPGVSNRTRPGIYLCEGNHGYYFDVLHDSYVDIIVRGSGVDVQHILDNLMLVVNGAYPHHVEYQPEHLPVTVQNIIQAVPGNISIRNAHYREGELWITVPKTLQNIRQRAKTIRIRITWRTRAKVLLTMLRAWLKDSFS